MSDLSNPAFSYIKIAVGAALWGTIGIFIEELSAAGFSALQIVALRMISASVLVTGYLLIKDPSLFRIKKRAIPYLMGTGILSLTFFSWCYFTTIDTLSLSVAVILLYTGPAFVIILSRIFLGEAITSYKLLALGLTFTGCLLVVQVVPFGNTHLSVFGILTGLGSGFGYALYSIFSKPLLKKHNTLTVITYTFLFASLALILSSGLFHKIFLVLDDRILIYTFALGLFPTALAYLFYTSGLSDVEAGRASITAMIEPVVAALIGVYYFGEAITRVQLVGILMVLTAVILIQKKTKTER